MIDERLRTASRLLAFRHDGASEGTIRAIAEYLDDVAANAEDESDRDYLAGLADGLRMRSRARAKRATEIH